MIFEQKLPALEPEMRGALRNHIIRKRQRLKQELEQDAIEKRMKREKEIKQFQDAMTLDQIKDQLSTLEKRLENLREEKHNLFVQLKQVLNEDNTRRKQHESDQKRIAETSEYVEDPQSITVTNLNLDHTSTGNDQKSYIQPPSNRSMLDPNLAQTSIRQSNNELITAPSPPLTNRLPLPNSIPSRMSAQLVHLNHGTDFSGGAPVSSLPTSIPPTHLIANANNIARHNLIAKHLSLADIHSQYRTASEYVAGQPASSLDFGHHLPAHSNQRPLLMDMPLSLATNHHDLGIPTNKRSIANLSEGNLDERLARKKANNFMYTGSNQFLFNGANLPPSLHGLPSNLSRYIPLSQLASSGSQSSSSSPPASLINNSFHPRKSLSNQLEQNLNFMMSQGKSPVGLMVPGLNSFYPNPQLVAPNQLYPNVETNDLKLFTSPYASVTQQQYATSVPNRHNDTQLPRSDPNAHYLPSSNSINHQRKHPYQKSPYQQYK